MSLGASRARLVEIRRDLASARRGREVLERKRELLLREVRRRDEVRAESRRSAARALEEARRPLAAARVALGADGLEAAALAYPHEAAVERRRGAILGVEVPLLSAKVPAFRVRYGAAATASALDRAGEAWARTVPVLVQLAADELAHRALKEGLAKCVRRLSALEKSIIPALERELREVGAALEEEDRDETVRRKRWLALRALHRRDEPEGRPSGSRAPPLADRPD